jgi:hypothetical protein
MLPTTPPGLTAAGAILGTLQYMSPEQLEGRDTDARTDIFAFGAVVHEMLTGKKAFEATSQAGLISAIMSSKPPPVSSIQTMATAALDHLVARCLARDVEDRWQSAHDLKLQLEWIVGAGSDARAQPPSTAGSRIARERIAWIAAALALAALAVVGVLFWPRPDAPAAVSQFSILAPDGARFTNDPGAHAVSPDGRQVVFAAVRSNGQPILWVRPLIHLPRGLSPAPMAAACHSGRRTLSRSDFSPRASSNGSI